MVTKLSPVDAKALEIIKSVSFAPVAETAESQAESSVAGPVAGFEKFKSTAGKGATSLFAGNARELQNRANAMFAVLQKQPIDVQAAVLGKLIQDAAPVKE